MSADARPGDVDVRVGLRVRRADDLGHVDTVDIGDHREFVGQRDVEVAVGAFGQLAQFSGFGRLELEHFATEHFPVEGGSAFARAGVDAADDLRVLRQVFDDAAHQQALGAEGDMEVAPEPAAANFEARGEFATGRAHREGCVEDAKSARLEALAGLFRSGEEVLEVRAPGVIDVNADREEHDVTLRDRLRRTGGRAKAAAGDDFLQHRAEAGLVGDRVFATVDAFDQGRVHIAAEDAVTLRGDGRSDRKADAPDADDSDVHARPATSPTRTGTPVSPERTRASATASAVMPSWALTGAGPPARTASRKASSSTRSGSRFGIG